MQLRGEGKRGRLVTESLVGGPEVIGRIEPAWEALWGASPGGEPFFRPGWVRAHLEAFEPGAKVRLVAAREGERLVGLLPLVEETARWRGLPFRRLRSASGVHSCRFDLLLHEGEEEAAAEAIWDHLAGLEGWHVIEVRDVPFGGEAERLLGFAEAAGHLTGTWESMRTPTIPLPKEGGMEAFLEELPGKFRANLRRRRRRLAERGALEVRRVDAADPVALERFYALEASGWKGAKGTAIAAEGATRAFYDRAAAWAAAEGMLRLYALELDGQPVAAHWGLQGGGRYFLPKAAYDEAHGASSPGQLLVEDVLRDCIEQGLEEFDFLGPAMTWKLDWTEVVRPHRWCFIHRPSAMGRALFVAKLRLGPWLARVRGR